ncbi:hypothetical protein D3C72_2488050 [compost metagenome]
MHMLPPYEGLQSFSEFPVINRISAAGINLPTYAALTEEDVAYISETLLQSL